MTTHGQSETSGSRTVRAKKSVALGYSGDALAGFIHAAVRRVNTEFPKAFTRLEKARAIFNGLSPELKLSRGPFREVIEISVDTTVRFTAVQLKPYFESHFHPLIHEFGFAFDSTRCQAGVSGRIVRTKCIVIFRKI